MDSSSIPKITCSFSHLIFRKDLPHFGHGEQILEPIEFDKTIL